MARLEKLEEISFMPALNSKSQWWTGSFLEINYDEAAPHLHHISLLCILLPIEEEEASCLVGVDEVDVQNHDGEVGEA